MNEVVHEHRNDILIYEFLLCAQMSQTRRERGRRVAGGWPREPRREETMTRR
jgi:hypothetical protein